LGDAADVDGAGLSEALGKFFQRCRGGENFAPADPHGWVEGVVGTLGSV
jgi:hypothetical protein